MEEHEDPTIESPDHQSEALLNQVNPQELEQLPTLVLSTDQEDSMKTG